MNPLSSLARQTLVRQLRRLSHGRLHLNDSVGKEVFGSDAMGLEAVIEVRDPRFYRAVILGGSVGAGEAWAAGWWHSPDLTAVVRLLVRNRDLVDGLETGLARLVQPARALGHALRRNTVGGSKRNIQAHYDLGNDFFELFLDDTLTYSCGIFDRPDATLRDASIAKYDRITKLLALTADDHVVEIGTGWGGFAIHAATTIGCRVTTTTISERQFAHASERMAALGLTDRIQLLKKDYRELTGSYSALVSIEMIEAVGHDNYSTYFESCARLLSPGGRAAIQAITIDDAQYESARREVDFIKRHIFPGSCIPSESVLRHHAFEAGLSVVQADDIGLHYAETLRRWRMNFAEATEQLESQGYDESFRRLWEFYFCYCEGGFLERAISNLQLTILPAGDETGQIGSPPAVPECRAAA